MKEEFFDKHDKKILNYLYRVRVGKSSTAIAKRLKMHWTTIEKSLKKLYSRDWVLQRPYINKTLWRFNLEKYERIKETERQKKKQKQD